MSWNRTRSLQGSVEARSAARPVRVAYLVPLDDSEVAQKILDAVFFESYTRWSGAHTLVIPVARGGFVEGVFKSWIESFDPDFIYAYSDLSLGVVEDIDRLCSPIDFLIHKDLGAGDGSRWRDYLPVWDSRFKPVSSISTVRSPEAYRFLQKESRQSEIMVFTQSLAPEISRLLSDNYGTSFDLYRVMNEVPGLYRTFCLTSKDTP